MGVLCDATTARLARFLIKLHHYPAFSQDGVILSEAVFQTERRISRGRLGDAREIPRRLNGARLWMTPSNRENSK
jgi:hypothetical protein